MQPGQNDYPSLAVDSRGELWASWISYADNADSVWVAHRGASQWEPPQRISGDLTDNFRTALEEDGQRRIWSIWSAKGGGVWEIYGRYYSSGRWSERERITGDEGPESLPRGGPRFRRQAAPGVAGFPQSQFPTILSKTWDGQRWSPEVRVSTGTADNWAPAIAADASGNVWIGWDGYQAGNFDIFVRRMSSNGQLGETRQITHSPGMTPTCRWRAINGGRLWISWDTAEANWGKDWNSQHFSPRGGNGLYRTRAVGSRSWKANGCCSRPRISCPPFPRSITIIFRGRISRWIAQARFGRWDVSLTSFRTRVQNNWGAGGLWEVLVTALEGDRWMPAVKLVDDRRAMTCTSRASTIRRDTFGSHGPRTGAGPQLQGRDHRGQPTREWGLDGAAAPRLVAFREPPLEVPVGARE